MQVVGSGKLQAYPLAVAVEGVLLPVGVEIGEVMPFQAAAQLGRVFDQDLHGHRVPPQLDAPHPDGLSEKAEHHVDIVDQAQVQGTEKLTQQPVVSADAQRLVDQGRQVPSGQRVSQRLQLLLPRSRVLETLLDCSSSPQHLTNSAAGVIFPACIFLILKDILIIRLLKKRKMNILKYRK